MRNSLLLCSIFIIIGCSESKIPNVLIDDYNLLSTDDGIKKFKQRNDTLYEYDCYVNQPCLVKPEAYKIYQVKKIGDFTVLKIKWLGKVDLGFSEAKYSMLVLKRIDKKQLGISGPRYNLTLKQLDSIPINILSLNKSHFSTYFSDTYLKELSTLKKISTKDQVKEITEALRDKKSGLITYSAEDLTKICIERGYNPVGAGIVIDSMMK